MATDIRTVSFVGLLATYKMTLQLLIRQSNIKFKLKCPRMETAHINFFYIKLIWFCD